MKRLVDQLRLLLRVMNWITLHAVLDARSFHRHQVSLVPLVIWRFAVVKWHFFRFFFVIRLGGAHKPSEKGIFLIMTLPKKSKVRKPWPMSCRFICEILWFSMANRRLTRGSRCSMYLDDGLLKSYLRAHDINVYVYVNIYIYLYSYSYLILHVFTIIVYYRRMCNGQEIYGAHCKDGNPSHGNPNIMPATCAHTEHIFTYVCL